MFITDMLDMAPKSVILTGLLFLQVMACEVTDDSPQVHWLAITNDDRGYPSAFALCDITFDETIQLSYNDEHIGVIRAQDPVGLFSGDKVTRMDGEIFQTMLIRRYNGSKIPICGLVQGKILHSSSLNIVCVSGAESGQDNLTWSEIANKRRGKQKDGLMLSYSCDEANIYCIVECHSRNANIISLEMNNDDISTNFMNATQVSSSNTTEEIQNRVLRKNNTSITAFVTFTGQQKHLQCKTESSLVMVEVNDDSAAATSTPPLPPPEDPTTAGPITSSSSHVHKGQK